MTNSSFSATLFKVVFTPDNQTLTFNIVGVSEIAGYVKAQARVYAYGFEAFEQTLNPCTEDDLSGLCPMSTGQINIESNAQIPEDVIGNIPGIAYTVPDLDGLVQIYISNNETGQALACVQAQLSNGKTVYQKPVGWVTAVIAGLGLTASAITSGLGHSNTAAHVAANALSLFGYFQAQAFVGMTAVHLPPIVASWTQNLQWSMGIIRVGFLQDMCTWYQRATGGTPSTLLSNLSSTSVLVQKRSLEAIQAISNVARRALNVLSTRSNTDTTNAENLQVVTVRGIKRVGFKAGIESTNIFLTGYSILIVFIIFVTLGVVLFKLACEGLAKMGRMRSNKFSDFRNGWTTVLKGILFRIVLIGFPQMVVMCFWEFTQRDSSAEVVLAVFTIVTMIVILAFASFKVWLIAQRSISLHKNPAYILYSDPVALNKWGFLYVQFKASAYYFVMPFLFYIFIKGLFVALAQNSGKTQAVALLIIEAGFLVLVGVMRPYMDKKTNAFNISIAVINFINVIFLLMFSNIFNQPGLVTGVMGVVFFVYNAAFSLVLLLMVLVASIYALVSKNPDTRYQPMRDDRGSFIKSQTQLGTTELDALGATARGDKVHGSGSIETQDDDSFSSSTNPVKAGDASLASKEGYTAAPPRSPIDQIYENNYMNNTAYQNGYNRSTNASPAPSYSAYPASNQSRNGSNPRLNTGRPAGSPFQRGVGYE